MLYALAAFAGVIIGAAVAWLLAVTRSREAAAARLSQLQQESSEARGQAQAIAESLRAYREDTAAREAAAAADFDQLRTHLAKERDHKARAETKLQETETRLVEQKKLLDEAESRLKETFKSLAGDSLAKNNDQFLTLAKEAFDKVLLDAKGELGKKEQAITGLVKPLSESLKQFDSQVRQLEKSRVEAYTTLEGHLKLLTTTHEQLQKETGNLVTALRRPETRGRWGELTLRRVVELAGMSEHCDFTEQVSVDGSEGRIRPDLVIHLAGGREIVVDAKVALDAFLNAVEAESEGERQRYLADHAQQVRKHVNMLASKAYWQQFATAPNLVVMFMSGESVFSAALEQDHRLLEDAMKARVMLATPTTLMTTLHSVAYGWSQESISRNAQEISELGKQLYERMTILAKHITSIGKGLEGANKSYNDAVGSMEARVFPAARKFRDLGISTNKDVESLPPIELNPRMLSAPELTDTSAPDQPT